MSYETDFAPKIEAKKIGSAGKGNQNALFYGKWQLPRPGQAASKGYRRLSSLKSSKDR